MSVLACNRRCCPNIMCDRLILNNTMYICDRCLEQLKAAWQARDEDLDPAAVYGWILSFMNTESPDEATVVGGRNLLDEEFDRLIGELN